MQVSAHFPTEMRGSRATKAPNIDGFIYIYPESYYKKGNGGGCPFPPKVTVDGATEGTLDGATSGTTVQMHAISERATDGKWKFDHEPVTMICDVEPGNYLHILDMRVHEQADEITSLRERDQAQSREISALKSIVSILASYLHCLLPRRIAWIT